MEIDLYPENNPAAADLIDGGISELSMFHEAFDYYAHGVGRETAMLPYNWRARVLEVANPVAGTPRAFVLQPTWLFLKLIAGREKDLGFIRRHVAAGNGGSQRGSCQRWTNWMPATAGAAQASLNAIADIPPDRDQIAARDIGAADFHRAVRSPMNLAARFFACSHRYFSSAFSVSKGTDQSTRPLIRPGG